MAGCHRLVTVQRKRHPGLKGLKGQTKPPKGLETNRQTGGDWFYWLAVIIRQNMVKKRSFQESEEKLSERWELVVRLGPRVPLGSRLTMVDQPSVSG